MITMCPITTKRKKLKGIALVFIILCLLLCGLIYMRYVYFLSHISGSTYADLRNDLCSLEGDEYNRLLIGTYYNNGKEFFVFEDKSFDISKLSIKKWDNSMPTTDHSGNPFLKSAWISIYECNVTLKHYVELDGTLVNGMGDVITISYHGYEDESLRVPTRAVIDSNSKQIFYSRIERQE